MSESPSDEKKKYWPSKDDHLAVGGTTYTREKWVGGGAYGSVWRCRYLDAEGKPGWRIVKVQCVSAVVDKDGETPEKVRDRFEFELEASRTFTDKGFCEFREGGWLDSLHENFALVFAEPNGEYLNLLKWSEQPLPGPGRRVRWQSPSHFVMREIIRQLCRALAALHEAGYLHRDLKPENVLIAGTTDNVLALIIDLGSGTSITPRLDAPPTVNGPPTTYEYRAPEVGPGVAFTAAADFFALGSTLFHVLTGVTWQQQTTRSVNAARAAAQLAPVDPAIDRLVERLMSEDPSRRPTGEKAFALANAIPAVAGAPTLATPGTGLPAATVLQIPAAGVLRGAPTPRAVPVPLSTRLGTPRAVAPVATPEPPSPGPRFREDRVEPPPEVRRSTLRPIILSLLMLLAAGGFLALTRWDVVAEWFRVTASPAPMPESPAPGSLASAPPTPPSAPASRPEPAPSSTAEVQQERGVDPSIPAPGSAASRKAPAPKQAHPDPVPVGEPPPSPPIRVVILPPSEPPPAARPAPAGAVDEVNDKFGAEVRRINAKFGP